MSANVVNKIIENDQRSSTTTSVMKFNEKQLAVACAILWGASLLVMGVANIAWHGYGQAFLDVIASVYPGYHAGGELFAGLNWHDVRRCGWAGRRFCFWMAV